MGHGCRGSHPPGKALVCSQAPYSPGVLIEPASHSELNSQANHEFHHYGGEAFRGNFHFRIGVPHGEFHWQPCLECMTGGGVEKGILLFTRKFLESKQALGFLEPVSSFG